MFFVDGLERLLRLLQASVQILIALVAQSPLAYGTIANALGSREVRRPLAELAGHLGLVRRFIRFFRFFEAFTNSYKAFTSLTVSSKEKGGNGMSSSLYLRKTLDGLASTFDGLYLLLEAATLVDTLAIEGLTIMDKDLHFATKIESQRCWFLALLFGALSCILRLYDMQTVAVARPAPAKTATTNAAASENDKAVPEIKKTQTAKTTAQQLQVSKKLMVCLLDLPLPGSIVGWIPASQGTLGLLMLTTSVLTGWDVWQRCGKEVGRA